MAEIAAAVVAAGDVSIANAIVAGEFVKMEDRKSSAFLQAGFLGKLVSQSVEMQSDSDYKIINISRGKKAWTI